MHCLAVSLDLKCSTGVESDTSLLYEQDPHKMGPDGSRGPEMQRRYCPGLRVQRKAGEETAVQVPVPSGVHQRGGMTRLLVCILPDGICFQLCSMSYVSYNVCVARRCRGCYRITYVTAIMPPVCPCFRFDPDQVVSPRKPQRVLKGPAYLGKAGK